jgi:hypothetical protein
MATLHNVMRINAASSGATGLLLLLFPAATGRLFEVEATWPFTAAGIFLLLFALFVFSEARHPVPRRNRVRWIIALDVLWVVESGALLVPGVLSLSVIGSLLIAGVALWVALMAYLQIRGLRQFAV